MNENSIMQMGKLLQLVPTFHAITAAATADKLALVPTTEAETGRPVLVLCAVVQGDADSDGLVRFQPLAELTPGNFRPPEDGELQYLSSVGGDVALIGAVGHKADESNGPFLHRTRDAIQSMLADLLRGKQANPEADEPMVPRELRRQRTEAVLKMLLKGKKLLPAPEGDGTPKGKRK